MGKLVSVIVPIYNVEKYLDECVQSIMKQTYSTLEIILVDDGATDRSGDMCDEYQSKDYRVRVVHKQNGGLSDARNAGMKVATGDYIYFCDSDDYLADNCIEELVECIEREQAEFVIFNAKAIGDRNDNVNPNSYMRKCTYPTTDGENMLRRQLLLDEYKPCAWLAFFNAKFLYCNNLIFEKGIIGEDELFSFYAYLKAKRVSYLDSGLYFHRIRQGSIMTTKQFQRRFVDYLVIYRKMIATLKEIDERKQKGFRECVIRIAKSLLLVWRNLGHDEQKQNIARYNELVQSIWKNWGFGDVTLLIRLYSWNLGVLCSGFRKYIRKVFANDFGGCLR